MFRNYSLAVLRNRTGRSPDSVVGRALISDASVEYAAGTWNVKPGRSGSVLIVKSFNGDVSAVRKLTGARGQPTARLWLVYSPESSSLIAARSGSSAAIASVAFLPCNLQARFNQSRASAIRPSRQV